MDKENTIFSKKKQDKSYTMTVLYLSHNIFFGNKDSYSYYDTEVNKTLLLKKSNNEYFIRYNDVNKKKIVSLQLKIENFYFGELRMFTNNITLIPIRSDDKELFRKCTEIWNKIIELIGINNPSNPPSPPTRDFVETTLDDNEDEFIMLDVEKNTSAIKDEYRNYLVFIFTSVFNNIPRASLAQYRY